MANPNLPAPLPASLVKPPVLADNGTCMASTVSRSGAFALSPAPGYEWVPGNNFEFMKAVARAPLVLYFNVEPNFYFYDSGAMVAQPGVCSTASQSSKPYACHTTCHPSSVALRAGQHVSTIAPTPRPHGAGIYEGNRNCSSGTVNHAMVGQEAPLAAARWMLRPTAQRCPARCTPEVPVLLPRFCSFSSAMT